jgi:chondroitin-sulfate-ABC endolyase/exolyase
MKKIYLCGVFLIACLLNSAFAQISPIDSIRNKYVDWLTGEGVNYSSPEINQRYGRFLNSGFGAKNLTGYNFANPGAVWNLAVTADQSAYTTLTEQKLIRLVFLYQIKGPVTTPNPSYHSPTLKDTILNIFSYLKAKGISSSTNFNMSLHPSVESFEIFNSVALRSSAYATAILLMKSELVAVGEFTHHMGALANLTSFLDPTNPNYHFTNPGFNTDVIRSTSQQRFCYVLAQDNSSSTRVADMAFLKNFISNSVLPAHGWSDCIKPDLTTYHHKGAYLNSYGVDALHEASILNLILANTSYKLSAAAQLNLKNAILNYRKLCKHFEIPRTSAGRIIAFTDAYNALRPALAYLYEADPVANLEAGREFMRLWALSPTANLNLQRANGLSIAMVHSMGGMQNMVNVLNAGLTATPEMMEGQFSFPYAGLSIHKYNGYHVSVKGTSRYIWHYENAANENVFGRYSSAGAIELLTTGSPATHDNNGRTLTGVDWSHVAGATAAYLPLSVLGTGTMRLFNRSEFLAHASLDSNGIFAMDYRDVNSVTPMSALKTVFFFKNKLLCLGSNIRDVNGTYPIHTTLFQTAIPSSTNTAYVNGSTVSGTSYSLTQTGGSLWATDEVGNGYVMPASAYNTGSVTVKRAAQSSMNHSNTTATSGNFSSAYINHGTAPASARYQFAIVMQGGSSGTQALATNFSSYFSILKQDSLAHVVKSVPDSVYNYVIWDTSAVLNYDVVKRSNKPAVIMSQKIANDRLKLSTTYSDLGFLEKGEYYQYNQIANTASRLYRVAQNDTVTVTLLGKWLPVTAMSNVRLSANGNNTRVSFDCISGFSIQTLLKKDIPPSNLGMNTLETDKQISLYPNPTNGTVMIHSENEAIQQVTIMDLTGKVLTENTTVVREGKNASLDLSSFAAGMYFIHVNNSMHKVIKQ